ncbi:MAG: alpha/beta hydrolase [Pseudomonadota bacterium]
MRPIKYRLCHAAWILIVLTLNGCVSATNAGNNEYGAPELTWLSAENARAVVVVTHGFNLAPDIMTGLGRLLQEEQMDVLQLSLAGHSPSLTAEQRIEEMAVMTGFDTWQSNMDQAIMEASERANALNVPLYLLGFSMGGLLSVDHLNRHPDSDVEAMVLLAPALSLRWTSWLLRPLGALPDFLLPSVGPDEYKANEYMPVSAYEALYEGVAQLEEQIRPERLDIPALLLISPEDELVSGEGLEEFITENGLDRWQLHRVDNATGDDDVLEHVIVDRNALGDSTWEWVTSRIIAFLDNPD